MPNISPADLLANTVGRIAYPTKEEIIAKPIKHKREVINVVRHWKKENWLPARQSNPLEKFAVIKDLLSNIAFAYGEQVNVEFIPNLPSCGYDPRTQTIFINNTVSIISSLHELAHHLFGDSELKACRWSIWLFKKTFPKAYSKLIWNQHMLVKPTPICPTRQIASPGDSTISSE